ncbi:MAG: glycerate 2-kinase [Gammaproteobacteria bacterium]|jgi:glycerate 2-kinase
MDNTQSLLTIWSAAISAVTGRSAVNNAITVDRLAPPDFIIAVGKAASGMCLGALDNFKDCPALVVTKYDHSDDELRKMPNVKVIESAHPVPDENSVSAGFQLIKAIQSLPDKSRLLMLVSGGASALAEALPDGFTLDVLQAMTDEMLSTGKTISEINCKRKEKSLIKDGKLLGAFTGQAITVYAISDVEGDDIATIGSGIGDCFRAGNRGNSRIIASNCLARDRASRAATELGLEVKLNEETLYGDVFDLASKLGPVIQTAEPGIYIWGGEPTVVLPPNPGQGGRNQSLALALSEYLQDKPSITVLIAGTDGTDGPTAAAGGIIDQFTFGKEAKARLALTEANAGPYLEASNSLFVTGPTNTNVMDLIIAIVV